MKLSQISEARVILSGNTSNSARSNTWQQKMCRSLKPAPKIIQWQWESFFCVQVWGLPIAQKNAKNSHVHLSIFWSHYFGSSFSFRTLTIWRAFKSGRPLLRKLLMWVSRGAIFELFSSAIHSREGISSSYQRESLEPSNCLIYWYAV